jgi:hypothetical protein
VDGSYHIPVTGAIARDNPLEITYPVGGKAYFIIEGDLEAPTVSMNELESVSPPAFEVSWVANDIGSGGNSAISQQLTVPAGKPSITATASRLALLYKVESAETDGGNGSCDDSTILHDKFEMIIEKNGDLEQIHCQEVASDWQYAFFDLSAYAAEEITLSFNHSLARIFGKVRCCMAHFLVEWAILGVQKPHFIKWPVIESGRLCPPLPHQGA